MEFLRGMIEGRHPQPPMARTLGYRLHEVAEGRAVFRGRAAFDMMNPFGGIHGGWYATILDSCLACAVMTRIPAGSLSSTLELKVNMIAPIPPGVEVDAVGEVDHAGRTTGVASGRIVGVADGRLYATGSTTCFIVRAR
jgi:uncharacterized protein (TIGR00369 family)